MSDGFMEKFVPGIMIAMLACAGLAVVCMLAAIATGNGYVGMATIWFLGLGMILYTALMIAVVVATAR